MSLPNTLSKSHHLENQINYKFVIALIAGIIGFHYFINSMSQEDTKEFVLSIFSIINPSITTIAAFAILSRYQTKDLGLKSKTFKHAHVALTLAFFTAAGGEFLYFLYDYVLDEPLFHLLQTFFLFPFIHCF